MHRGFRILASSLLLLILSVPALSLAQSTVSESSGFCKVIGWLVQPLGFCEVIETPVVVVAHDTNVVDEVASKPTVPQSPPAPPTIIEYSTTTQPIYNEIKNEYVTVQQTGVSEEVLNSRIAQVLMYINSLPHGATVVSGVSPAIAKSDNDSVTREFLEKSLDRVYDRIGRGDSNNNDFDTTNASFNGNTALESASVSGRLGVGTTSPLDVLSVDGAIYLAQSNPSDPTNRLYNLGSQLYWNGAAVAGAATSSAWSVLAGNTYRASGNVGIGTTTPDKKLVVEGAALFTGTTTGRIVDSGGQVCNVTAYGAVGDNSTLNDAAIARAIAACPLGGVVFFPMGQFRIASPIVLDKPVTLRGSYSSRWSYASTPRSSIRADFGTFSGTAIIHVRDKSISGQAADNNGGRFENLTIDGGSAGSNVKGMYFEGLVRDWRLTDVDILQTTGNGFEAAVGTGSGNPRGFTIRGLSVYSADGHGFRATALNDSYIEDLLAVGNALRGIYLSSMGETKVNNSRAVFNGLTGLYVDGSSNNGGVTFTDFSTDRNDRHGVRISMSGTSTVIFSGLLTRRDGANTSGGSETPYAGVAIIGSPAEPVAPVFINGLAQTIGVDDSGNPPLAPSVGVRATNATYVKIDGQLWGVDQAYSNDGGNENFLIEDDSVLKVGPGDNQQLYANERKWVATSTGLFYGGGSASIGSSTGSNLLNIIAPERVSALLQDTTNNVILDMRADDLQAFVGTISNHELRLQTNGTSRMTIDVNGRVGIGTTTPNTNLTVVGDGYFTGAFRDSTNSPGTIGYILQTTGVGSRWVSTSTLGFPNPGSSSFLGLSDTPNYYNTQRIPFTNTAGTALTDSSQLTYDGNTLKTSSGIDQTALRVEGSNVSVNSVMALTGPLSTTLNNGKAFQFGVSAETFGRGQFYTDGSYGIGPGTATRDTFLSRLSTSTLLVSSNRTQSGAANLSVTGNVGVGTTSPVSKLTVAQSADTNGLSIRGFDDETDEGINMYVGSDGTFAFDLQGPTGFGYLAQGGDIVGGWSASRFGIADNKEFTVGDDADYSVGYHSASDSFRIADGDDVSANVRLTLLNNGNIGIGTTTADAKLDVIGTIQASNLLGGATNLTTDSNGNIIRDPSDERLKTNITNVDDALNKVLALRGVKYKWLDEERFGDQMEIGFIAQEVDRIVPEVVRKGGDYWSINTRNLLALVVEAIEDIWKTVSGNTEKIADLESRVRALESKSEVVQTPVIEEEKEEDEEDQETKKTATTTATSTESESTEQSDENNTNQTEETETESGLPEENPSETTEEESE